MFFFPLHVLDPRLVASFIYDETNTHFHQRDINQLFIIQMEWRATWCWQGDSVMVYTNCKYVFMTTADQYCPIRLLYCLLLGMGQIDWEATLNLLPWLQHSNFYYESDVHWAAHPLMAIMTMTMLMLTMIVMVCGNTESCLITLCLFLHIREAKINWL